MSSTATTAAAGFAHSVFRSAWPSRQRAHLNPLTSAVVASISCSFSTVRASLRNRAMTNPRRRPVSRRPPVSCSCSGDAFRTGSLLAPNGCAEYTRLLPCPLENGPPRVEHLVVSKEGKALDIICEALNVPPLFVTDLINFGAVYYALVCPKPPPTATPEQLQIFKEVTAPEVLQKRPSIKGKTIREAQKTYRISDPGEIVEAGTYLRVHVHPKRFPRCYKIDWKSRVIAVADSYIVLDKPAGTSVGGTTDNIEECCATFASRALGFPESLKTTHQIDNCTEGCVVFARTKEFCSIFHGLIREKQVKKLYVALAVAPVPVGILSHYMRPVNIAPRIVSKGLKTS